MFVEISAFISSSFRPTKNFVMSSTIRPKPLRGNSFILDISRSNGSTSDSDKVAPRTPRSSCDTAVALVCDRDDVSETPAGESTALDSLNHAARWMSLAESAIVGTNSAFEKQQRNILELENKLLESERNLLKEKGKVAYLEAQNARLTQERDHACARIETLQDMNAEFVAKKGADIGRVTEFLRAQRSVFIGEDRKLQEDLKTIYDIPDNGWPTHAYISGRLDELVRNFETILDDRLKCILATESYEPKDPCYAHFNNSEADTSLLQFIQQKFTTSEQQETTDKIAKRIRTFHKLRLYGSRRRRDIQTDETRKDDDNSSAVAHRGSTAADERHESDNIDTTAWLDGNFPVCACYYCLKDTERALKRKDAGQQGNDDTQATSIKDVEEQVLLRETYIDRYCTRFED